jgi:hypothetical protein
MSAPTPDLLYLLGTDAATSLVNHGSDTGAPAATFINYSLANIANAINYASNFATIGSTASLDSKYAPTTSFALAMMIRIAPSGATFQPMWGVRKVSPSTGYSTAFARTDIGPTLADNVSGGVVGIPEWGWCPIGVIFSAPSTLTYVHQGRITRRMSQDFTSSGGNISGNDATGKIIFGGAGWASGYSNVQVAECSVFKAPPTVTQMRAYLETMRARSVDRGLPVF